MSGQEEKDGLPSEADLLIKLTTNVRPDCDLCGNKVGTAWYKEKSGGNKSNRIMFQICSLCFKTDKYPNLYIKNDFKRMSLIDKIKDIEEPKNWTNEQYKQLLKDIKECNSDIGVLLKKYSELEETTLIKLILKLPFSKFKIINKISIKNFELFFKEKIHEKNSVLDTVNANPLIEHVG